jgi:preprotein translocase subunit SecA
MSALSKIFGSHSERELKRIYPIADKVESYKEAMGKLSDEELKDKTREFKKRLEDGAWQNYFFNSKALLMGELLALHVCMYLLCF